MVANAWEKTGGLVCWWWGGNHAGMCYSCMCDNLRPRTTVVSFLRVIFWLSAMI